MFSNLLMNENLIDELIWTLDANANHLSST